VLRRRLESLGAETHIDDAGQKVGGDCGNLIARLPGIPGVSPLLLSAHMDTVEPGRGVTPKFDNGIFTSSGDTILGADDKCGLAIILEVLTCITEKRLPCGPLEIAFSICEEIGPQGAKHLDYSQLTAKMGYVLDTRNPEVIVTRAPALNQLILRITGKAAHAGAEPEKGINAIALAARAMDGLELGRIDDETTCNVGTIQGGRATNIVPDSVTIRGEVRSHNPEKLKAVTEEIVRRFQQSVDAAGAHGDGDLPRLRADVHADFAALRVDQAHPVVELACEAAANLNRPLTPIRTGGGSDANVFAQHGIVACVLGIGCSEVHTVDERANLNDMKTAAELLIEVIRIHAQKYAL
jgi:tripeptide aminopeptidase